MTSVASTTTTTIPAVLEGTVLSEDGGPLVGVEASLGDRSVLTDGSGTFTMESNRGGPVSLSKPGWLESIFVWDGESRTVSIQMERWTVRGLHVSGDAAGDDDAFTGLLDLAARSAINTLVFDTKQEGGTVLYESGVDEAHELGAVSAKYDPVARVAQAHYAGLYTITRIVTFEDRPRADARPEEKMAGPWVDPTSKTAWDYNIALAVEACSLGFDEVQFDYVRFPSGRTAVVSGQLDMTQSERVGAISGFLEEARRRLHPMGCGVSAAIFGIVLATENDQGLGQRPEEISRATDAISPMVYPSHYADGWIGYADPNDYPYEVTANAIDDALPRISPGSTLRPWLQGFWWTNDQILESIRAAEERGVGWMLWNVRSEFSLDALPTDGQVGD